MKSNFTTMNYSINFLRRITQMTLVFSAATLMSWSLIETNSKEFVKPKEPDALPVYGECDDDTEDERQQCSSWKLKRYFSDNMIYPAKAKEEVIEGKVIIEMTINIEGEMENVHVQKTAHKELNAEALRLCNSLGKWRPALRKNKPMPARIFVPVNFNKRSEAFLKE